MNGKDLRSALRNGDIVYGTLVVSSSPVWSRVMGGIGLDYVFLCTEHHALNRETLSWMCRTYSAMNIVPLVRIPSPDPYQATAALDDGAAGVIAPYVETVEEVWKLVGATKYRPLKGERLKRIMAGKETLSSEMADYIKEFNKNNVLVVNIESRTAIKNLQDLLAIPGLDGVLVGPHDMTSSYEIPEYYSNKEFITQIDNLIVDARAAGKGVGYHKGYAGPGIEQEILWGKRGMNMILHEADIIAFSYNMTKDLNTIKAALGGTSEKQQGVTI